LRAHQGRPLGLPAPVRPRIGADDLRGAEGGHWDVISVGLDVEPCSACWHSSHDTAMTPRSPPTARDTGVIDLPAWPKREPTIVN
jgi:hypothetical protein